VIATILFLAYNQQDFVAQAAQSCLAQVGEPLEIILSDDCSTDNTYAILQQVASQYTGPHRVVVRQNHKNLGIADHYNTLVELAHGQLLLTAAGDDISYPERAQTLYKAWQASACKLDLIASYAHSITYDGQANGKTIKVDQLANWKTAADWCAKRPYVVGATHAFTKRIWTEFGPIASDIPYEDQIVALRALCLGGAQTLELSLVDYRTGGVSAKATGRSPEEKHQHIEKRYTRQKALFLQVQKDLVRAGQAQLWTGKVKRYLDRSVAALWLLRKCSINLQNLNKIWEFGQQCGWFWLTRQIYYSFISGNHKR
jgi:glycosyltransferase involved in cell wall biosynthesis